MNWACLLCLVLAALGTSSAIRFLGEPQTYAKYPKWNACINASIAFEFNTRQKDGLLMYTDDNGRYDYLQVAITEGAVRLWINFVQEKEQTVEIELGRDLNDGRWHRVQVVRNRMETTLLVDSNQSSKVAFGSDFNFGDEDSNSHVYFGGVPSNYLDNLKRLNLPEEVYNSKFSGEMRNIIYFNCTCLPIRTSMLEGQGVRDNFEACDRRNPCPADCHCVSSDSGSGCECRYKEECAHDLLANYRLPMDVVSRDLIENPSGLEARVYGGPRLVKGVKKMALRIQGANQWINVTGSGHKKECFGNLNHCDAGYFLGMWLKFEGASDKRSVYLTNGAHRPSGHGVAMMFGSDGLEVIFKAKDGQTWKVKDQKMVEGRWYHVAASWEKTKGLYLYINGRQTDHTKSPRQSTAASDSGAYEDFVIGRSNDMSELSHVGTLNVDEFLFMSKFKDEKEAMAYGAASHYHIFFDRLSGDKLDMSGGEATMVGGGRLIPGKIGKALSLSGRGEYVDLGDTEGRCLGDLEYCQNGFYVSFFVKFPTRLDNYIGYLFSSPQGVNIYQRSTSLIATAQKGRTNWEVRYPRLIAGRWFFVEVSWDPEKGLSLFIDQQEVARRGRESFSRTFSPSVERRAFLGRSNSGARTEFGKVVIDDLDILYAGKDMLADMGYVLKDRPQHYHFDFEKVQGRRLVHDKMLINLNGDPNPINGKIGKALQLDGSQFVDFGDQSAHCFGNLDLCQQGILFAFWLRPDVLTDNTYFLSSGDNGVRLKYSGRRLHAIAQTSHMTWEASSQTDIDSNQWHYVEISYHPMRGMTLYINNRLVAEDATPSARSHSASTTSTSQSLNGVFLGRGNVNIRGSQFAEASYDDMDVWFADRSYLTSHGIIQRLEPRHFVIDFEELIGNDRLKHPTLSIVLVGRPALIPGKVNNALALRGRGQYADLGRRGDECMSNLYNCRNGITIAAWMRFHRFLNNMVFLSSGENGILMMYRNGYIQVSADKRGTVSVGGLITNRWYFIEITWHPDTGLRVYVDNELVGRSGREHVERPPNRGSFYIGKKNHGDVERAATGVFDVDQMEIWYGRREDLIAFNYIDRENLGYEAFSFDSATGSRVTHNKYKVKLVNQASIGPGRFDNAVLLNGRGQYVDLGRHIDTCFGNLDHCTHGVTVSLWIKPNDLKDGSTYLSSPTYNLFYEDGEINSVFRGKEMTWSASSPLLRKGEWQRVTLTWHPKKGLTMYLNDELVGRDSRGVQGLPRTSPASRHVYVGRALDSASPTANVMADELQVWYDDLEQLRSTNQYIVQVVPRTITFDAWRNNHIRTRDRVIRGHGDLQIVRGKGAGTRALYLPGTNSYLDLGANYTCSGDLDTCHQGATLRLGLRPVDLQEGMVFLDSWPVQVFYENGRLNAVMQTSEKVWKVDSGELARNRWQRVELTWHPRHGLVMYIDGQRVAHGVYPETQTSPVPQDWRTYLGRALEGGHTYANTAVDNIEFWQAYRDYLPADEYLKIISVPERRPDTTTTTRRTPVIPPEVISIYRLENEQVAPTPGLFAFVTPKPQERRTPRPNDPVPKNSNLVKTIVFNGRSVVKFNLGRLKREFLQRSDTGEFQFYFSADRPDGIIWAHVEAGRRMFLAMRNGHLVFVNIDGGSEPTTIPIGMQEGARFDDGLWHLFKIVRNGRRISLTVDKRYRREHIFSRNVQFLTNADIFLGGANRTMMIDGRRMPNFAGKLTQIYYNTFVESPSGDSTTQNTVELIARIGDKDLPTGITIVTIDKGLIFQTPKPVPNTPPTTTSTTKRPLLTAITLKDHGFFIKTTDRFSARKDASISFKFSTIHPNGLLLYSTSNVYGKNFFALELYDGKLYFVHHFGDKTHRTLLSETEVADGQQHEVQIQFKDRYLNLMLDGNGKTINFNGRERLPRALGNLYIGGHSNYQILPWHTWARQSYQGCLEDLKISGRIYDLHSYVRNEGLQGSVETTCVAMPRQCSILSPCGEGHCTNSWKGYKCDCRGTDYRGDRCELPAWTGLFNGSMEYRMTFTPQRTYHVNDISLRFMSLQKDGLIFQTRARTDGNFMRAELKDGRVWITTNLGGKQRILKVGENLNDRLWHNLFIRRRGNQLEAWVDTEENRDTATLQGADYYLKLDDLFIGGDVNDDLNLPQDIPNLVGYLRNFYIGGYDVIGELEVRGQGPFYIYPDIPYIVFNDVTIATDDSHITLPGMRYASDLNIHFLFKTRDESGVILLNEGSANELFVVELFDKRLHMKIEVPNKLPMKMSSSPTKVLNDGKWHSVSITTNKGLKQVNMGVDGKFSSASYNGLDLIDLRGPLYIGGLPLNLFKDQRVHQFVRSKNGFRGCLASFDLGSSRGVQDLYAQGLNQGVQILNTCQDIKTRCFPDTCKNNGICYDFKNNGTTWCDCRATGWAGQFCEDEPLGYYFGMEGKINKTGMLVYNYPALEFQDNDKDEIVFGVMTNQKDGVIAKLISDIFQDFIQIKLVNGYAQAEYSTDQDGSVTTVSNSKNYISDGRYHIIRFVRTADNGTLYVDGHRTGNKHLVPHGKFERLSKIFVGGVLQGGKIAEGTGQRGIVGGLYVNGELIFPYVQGNIRTEGYSDVTQAPHPFTLLPLEKVTPKPVVTPVDPVVPGTLVPVVPPPAGPGPDAGNLAAVSAIADFPAVGPRAGAVMGAILGVLLLASSLIWAFYKCKPGCCPCCSCCAGGAGAGKAGGAAVISSPRAASNMGAVQAATAAGAGSGSGAVAGGALASADGIAAGGGAGGTDVVDAPDGRFGTGVGGGGSSTMNSRHHLNAINANTFSSNTRGADTGFGTLVGGGSGGGTYYSQHSTASSTSANHQRGDSYDSATLRALGTFSNKGTAIGTPKPSRAQFGSTASASGYSMSEANQSYQFEGNNAADYDVATGVHGNANYHSNTLSAGGGGGFSSATMSSNYNYTVKTIKTVGGMYGGSQSNIIVTPGAMGEEVRVDCCLMTTDGHSVVTGSSLGPPQVWNMSSGELLRIMQGETVGSTFLHLVNGDRLLVGAINSDIEINQYSVPKGVHNYIFQIWDFASGRPLEMAEHETCSALTVLSDNDKVIFARSDKFGGGTNIVVWDLLGNQPVKELRYDAPIGNNDYVSYLAMSQTDRYAVTGFTNTFDNFAEFVIFDMNQSSYNVNDPNILRLDALPECTAILPRDEAVTGLRNGDLVVWNLVTGQPSRQLVSSNGKHAHMREVKAVVRSKDNRYLVSASADGTLKLWDLETERQLTTMSAHSDEVWCCAISEDNEIIVSGSRDGTIRLWKLRSGQEIASFNAGVDVFYITMSKDKGTIVALGDKFGARKLVMLQVVRSKIKRQVLA